MDGYSAVLIGGALLTAIVAMGVAFHAHARALAGGRLEAQTDTLTGLGNRRKLLEDLEDALARPARGRLLLAFDLDGFKAYNDRFGHPAGDALLAQLGRRIEAALPEGAHAYRLGGDEFCALVPDEEEGYGPIVDAVARTLSAGGGVTASHGAVAVPGEADSPERVLTLADRRVYAAKAARGLDGREAREALAEALHGRRRAAGFDPVAELAGRVARGLGLWGEQLELVVRAAELHEVGKAAIPETILTKPQPLDERERALLRRHPLAGERMLAAAEPLGPVAELVRACDERFDGSGHPDGLAGAAIPVGARIVAACEAFHHALAASGSEREALARVRAEAGARFDPEVVEALAATIDLAPRAARSGVAATLAVAALMLALPGTALAGTATVSGGKLDVKASPGQANHLTIETKGSGDDSWVLVKEEGPGAALTPRNGCAPYAPGQVGCADPGSITVDAGDGADRVAVLSWAPSTVRGGPGDDALYGGGGRDTLEGMDGNDTLGGGFGGDTIRGGPGNDTVTYSYFRSTLWVSLDGRANDGPAYDRSNVATDVENVIGGAGNDTLSGNSQANALDGGPGLDKLRGEAGDDTLRAREGERDELNCGAGADAVTADPVDALSADCERTVQTSPVIAPAVAPVKLGTAAVRLDRRGAAPLRLRCSAALEGDCRGTVILDVAEPAKKTKSKSNRASAARVARRRVIGRAQFVVRRGKLKVVKVRISRAGRRRVMRRRKLRCRASVAVRRSTGSVSTVRGVVTLRAPKGKR